MFRLIIKRFTVYVLSFCLLSIGFVNATQAGIIGTQTLIESEQTQRQQARIEAFMARDSVRDQMLALGVDSNEVRERLAALTPGELQVLDEQIDTLPAGGILAVIGVVFIVLIILELTGVIDIFKKT
jgi:hypothetical protein